MPTRDTVAMLVEHRGACPEVHPSAWIAPTAVLCGAVRVRVLRNAVVTAEDLMARVMPRQTAWLAAHRDDRVL